MSLTGFITGSLIPHLAAHAVPTAAYVGKTLLPFVGAHIALPLVGVGAAVGGIIVGAKIFMK